MKNNIKYIKRIASIVLCLTMIFVQAVPSAFADDIQSGGFSETADADNTGGADDITSIEESDISTSEEPEQGDDETDSDESGSDSEDGNDPEDAQDGTANGDDPEDAQDGTVNGDDPEDTQTRKMEDESGEYNVIETVYAGDMDGVEEEEITADENGSEPDYSWYTLRDSENTDSYTIVDAADLLGFANIVNGTAKITITETDEDGEAKETVETLKDDFAGKTIYLNCGNDGLDMSVLCGETGFDDDGNYAGETGTGAKNWTPIGSASSSFNGSFIGSGNEGDNKIIKGLYINSTASYQGLFGYTGASCKFKNIKLQGKVSGGLYSSGLIAYAKADVALENITVDVELSNTYSYTGGLVGYAKGAVTAYKCINSGNLVAYGQTGGLVGWANAGVTAEYCENSGNITGSSCIGGLIGKGYSSAVGEELKNCTNKGNVASTASNVQAYAGGMIGYSSSCKLTDCVNKKEAGISAIKDYVGGMIGEVEHGAELKNCVNEASVTSEASYAGGLIGYAVIDKTGVLNGVCTVEYCGNMGNVRGVNYVGGLVGYTNDNNRSDDCVLTVKQSYSVADITGSTYVGGLIGYIVTSHSDIIVSVSDCYAEGKITGGTTYIGALVGYFSNGSVEKCFFYDASGDTSADVFGNYNSKGVSRCYYLKGSEGGALPTDGSLTVDADFFKSEDGLFKKLGGEQSAWLAAGESDNYPKLKAQDAYEAVKYTVSVIPVGSSDEVTSVKLSEDGDTWFDGKIDVLYNASILIKIVVPGDGQLVVSDALGESEKVEDNTGTVTYTYSYKFTGREPEIYYYSYKVGSEDETSVSGWYTDITQDGNYSDGCYHISTAAELRYLGSLVAGSYYNAVGEVVQLEEKDSFEGKTIVLDDDIDISQVCGATGFDAGGNYTGENGTYSASWQPIGSSTCQFKGTLDGKNHKITGLYIDAEEEYQGLFGYINNATIKDLTVNGTVVSTENYAAMLTAYASGTVKIENVKVEGSVTSSDYSGAFIGNSAAVLTMANCGSSTNVTGMGSYTGGLIGRLTQSATIEDCNIKGNIKGTKTAGGFVGYISGATTVKDCSIEGDITGTSDYTGGFIGFQSAALNISFCGIKGNITGSSSCTATGGGTGGLVGYAGGSFTVNRCYVEGDITGSRVSGLLGYYDDSYFSISANATLRKTGTVENYYVAGKITGVGDNYGSAGGFASESLPYTVSMKNCFFYSEEESTAAEGYDFNGLFGSCKSGSVKNCYFRNGDKYGSIEPASYAELNEEFFSSENGLLAALKEENGWQLTNGASYPTLQDEAMFLTYPHTFSIGAVGASDEGVSVSISAKDSDGKSVKVNESDRAMSITVPSGTDVTVKLVVPDDSYFVASAVLGEAETSVNGSGTTYTYTYTSGMESVSALYYYKAGGSGWSVPEGLENIKTSTTSETYTIKTARELKYISELAAGYYVNEVGDEVAIDWVNFQYKTIELGSDIDLTEMCGATGFDEAGNPMEGGTYSKNWIPVGVSDTRYFKGLFDGNGYTVKNLYIDADEDYQGLFGYVYGYYIADTNVNNTLIRNLNVEGSVTGGSYTGGIAGYINTGKTNSFSAIYDLVKDSTFVGSVCGSDMAGGIAGSVSSVSALDGCTVKAGSSVKAKGDYAGGIAGYVSNICNMINCNVTDITVSAEGDYAGGLAGYFIGGPGSNVTRSVSTVICGNSVLGDTSVTGGNYVGGAFGYIIQNTYGSTADKMYGIISTAAVTGSGDYIGGVIGQQQAMASTGMNSASTVIPSMMLYANPSEVTGGSSAEHVGQISGEGEYKDSYYAVEEVSGADSADTSALSVSEFVHGEALYLMQRAELPDSNHPVYWKQGEMTPEFTSEYEAEETLYKVYVGPASEKDNDVVSMKIKSDDSAPEWGYQVLSKNGAVYTYVKSGTALYLYATSPNIEFLPSDAAKFTVDPIEGARYEVETGSADINITYSTYENIDADISWYDDESDSFILYDEADLIGFAELVNGGNTMSGKTIALGGDISLDSGRSWVPVGTKENPFKGTFNGSGYTVSKMYILRSEYEDTGLFGYTAGTVENLKVTGLIDGTEASSRYIGGIAGRNAGSITNAASAVNIVSNASCIGGITGENEQTAVISEAVYSGIISADNVSIDSAGGIAGDNIGLITDSELTGSVVLNGTGGYAGGIAGKNTGVVSSCTLETGSITGTASYAGGIVGYHAGRLIEKCANKSDISVSADRLGGIAGSVIDADIILSYNTGTVYTRKSYPTYVGGIAGYLTTYNTTANIGRCYNTGAVTGDADNNAANFMAGILAYSASTECQAAIYECYSTIMPEGSGSAINADSVLARTSKLMIVQNSYASTLGSVDNTAGVATLSAESDLGFSYTSGEEVPQLAYLTDNGGVTLNYQESILYDLNSNSTDGVDYCDSVRNVSSGDALTLMKAALEKDYSEYYDALIRAGYWYTLDESGGEIKVLSLSEDGAAEQASFMPNEDTVYYLKWNTDAEPVTFHYMNGTGDCGLTDEYVETVAVGYNSTYTFPVPYREGYQLVGWYTAENTEGSINYYGTKVVSYKADPDDEVDGIEVYAKWQNGDISWYIEDTDASEYLIEDAADIIGLAQIVSGITTGDGTVLQDSFAGKTVKVKKDAEIDLSGVNWILPIGCSEKKPFSGVFDGQDAVISGLTIYTAEKYQALFGIISGAEILNITVKGDVESSAGYTAIVAADICGDAEFRNVTACGSVTDTGTSGCIGGVAGYISEGCNVTMIGVTNKADISGSSYLGGVIGCDYSGTVANGNLVLNSVSNEGNVTGTGGRCGGIIGQAMSSLLSVSDCENSGNVSGAGYIGGLAGYVCNLACGIHCDNRNTGSVTATGNFAGGLFGYLKLAEDNTNTEAQTVLRDSGNEGIISGSMYTGGVIGQLSSNVYDGFYRLYNEADISGTSYTCGIIGDVYNKYIYLEDSYSTGNIKGTSYTAGLIGTIYKYGSGYLKLTNCYVSGDVAGSSAANTGLLMYRYYSYLVANSVYNCYYIVDNMKNYSESLSSTKDYSYVTAASDTDLNSGALAWKLNTNDGIDASTVVWSQESGEDAHPVFADGTHGAICKTIVPDAEAMEGSSLTVTAAHAEGNDAFCGYDSADGCCYTEEGAVVTLTAVHEQDENELAYMVIRGSDGKVISSASTSDYQNNELTLTFNAGYNTGNGTADFKTYQKDEDKEYTVTFNANGGYFGEDSQKTVVNVKVRGGETLADALEKLTEGVSMAGMETGFSGWYLEENGLTQADGNAFVLEDMTLYAGFSNFLTVTFNVDNYGGEKEGDWSWPQTKAVLRGETVESVDPPVWASTTTSSGNTQTHNFIGWYTARTGGIKWNFESSTVAESMTLYAQWETVTNTVSYDTPVGGSVSSVADLKKLAWTIRDGVSYDGSTITLNEDIEMTDGFVIGEFSSSNDEGFDGTFDGNGHTLTIKNFDIDTSYNDKNALFYSNQGTIKNLKVQVECSGNVDICYTNYGTIENCSISGGGVFVSHNFGGSIKNCINEGNSDIVTVSHETSYVGAIARFSNGGCIENCVVGEGVRVNSWMYAGGIVGAAANTEIKNCVNNAEIVPVQYMSVSMAFGGIAGSLYDESSVDNCVNNGDVKGSDYESISSSSIDDANRLHTCGGIIGYMSGTDVKLSMSYNTGNVSGAREEGGIAGNLQSGIIENCYSTGDVTKGNVTLAAGGVAGYAKSGTVTSSYWFGSSSDGVSGVVGESSGDNVTVTNCYYGCEGDNSADGSVADKKSADAFASGEVAWLLDTNGGSGSHQNVWSMNDSDSAAGEGGGESSEESQDSSVTADGASEEAQTVRITEADLESGDNNDSESVKYEGSEGQDDESTFSITEEGNYTSPVLSSNGIWKAGVTYSEEVEDFDISSLESWEYDPAKDKAAVTLNGKTTEAGNEEKTENSEGSEGSAAVYFCGSSSYTMNWKINANNLITAVANYMEATATSVDYEIVDKYSVKANGSEIGTAQTGSYTGEPGDFSIAAKCTVIMQWPEEEKEKKSKKKDPVTEEPEQQLPSGDVPGTGTGSNPDGSDPNGSANGTPDGTGGASEASPVVSTGGQNVSASPIAMAVPVINAVAEAMPEAENIEDTSVPLAEAAGGSEEEVIEDEPVPEEDVTVLEVVQDSIADNPLVWLLIVVLAIALIAFAGYSRYRKIKRGKGLFK